jgi:hypothetical protein
MTPSLETWLLVAGGLAILLVVLLGVRLGRAYLAFRGTRLVTCPETLRPAAVELDAQLAAWTAMIGEPVRRVAECSRWPERASCNQECLRQLAHAPGDCRVRTMLTGWYEGRRCALCHTPFGGITWHDRKPAIMGADRITRTWEEIAPETLPEALVAGVPVCWSCHVAESFRRLHPDLFVDRPWRRDDRPRAEQV